MEGRGSGKAAQGAMGKVFARRDGAAGAAGDGLDLRLQVEEVGRWRDPGPGGAGLVLAEKAQTLQRQQKAVGAKGLEPFMRGLKGRFGAVAQEDQRQVQALGFDLAGHRQQELLQLKRAAQGGRQVDAEKGPDHATANRRRHLSRAGAGSTGRADPRRILELWGRFRAGGRAFRPHLRSIRREFTVISSFLMPYS